MIVGVRSAIIAAWLLLALGGPAEAAFLIPAIVAALGLTGVVAAVVTFVGQVALAFGLSWVASKLFGAKPPKVVGGTELDLRADADIPQALIVGSAVTAGSLVYAETYGKRNDIDNSDLLQIIALADHPCEGLVKVYIDSQEATFQPQGGGTPNKHYGPDAQNRELIVDDYDGKLAFKFYDGSQTSADSFGQGAFKFNPYRPYGPSMVGTGITYVRIHSIYDREIVPGPMRWRFVLDGIRLYDPRKDTTVGGSGSHRFGILSTHEFTANLAVIAYNILRGIRVNDVSGTPQHFYGLENTPAENLPLSNWIAAMNECDVLIDGEPQFHGGAEIAVDHEPLEVLKSILRSCDGRLSEVGGVYKLYVGPPGVPVLSFTDGDLVASQSDDYKPVLSLTQRVNYITATYTAPEDDWVPKVAAPRGDPDMEAEDGRRLPADLDVPLVQTASHVQRLQKQMLKRARQEQRHVIVLPPAAYGIEPGDIVEWNSERNAYVDKLFEVDSVDELPNLCVTVAITATDQNDYSWNGATDLIDQPDGSLVSNRPGRKIIEGFHALPHIHKADGEAHRAAIKVTWDVPSDGDLVRIEVQVRRPDQASDVATFSSDEPTAGEMIILAAILPDSNYEVRGRFISFSGLGTEWSLWIPVHTPDQRLIRQELSDDLDARIRQLEERIPDDLLIVKRQLDQLAGALSAQFTTIVERVGRVNIGVGAVAGDAAAGVELALAAVAEQGSALAVLEADLNAVVNDRFANGNIRFVVAATPTGATASFAIEVNVGTVGSPNWSKAGIYLDAFA